MTARNMTSRNSDVGGGARDVFADALPRDAYRDHCRDRSRLRGCFLDTTHDQPN